MRELDDTLYVETHFFPPILEHAQQETTVEGAVRILLRANYAFQETLDRGTPLFYAWRRQFRNIGAAYVSILVPDNLQTEAVALFSMQLDATRS